MSGQAIFTSGDSRGYIGEMPARISSQLLGKAQQLLSPEVLAVIGKSPKARLPDATWARLSPEQRAMVLEVRKNLNDGFENTERPQDGERARSTGERRDATPYAGRDPLTSTGQVSAAAGPDPQTGLDPVAMNELFGAAVDTTGLEQFEGEGLLLELRKRFYSRHVTLDYRTAREKMFTVIDNDGQGNVKDVYAGRTIKNVNGIPNAEGPNGFNTEHTWPQSQLKAAGKGAAVSDLHHLYPSETFANGKRGHIPFGWVKRVEWQTPDGQSKLGYNERGQMVWTAPEGHRGNIARAMFWVAAAYELDIPPEEEAVLREWAREDPVDDQERARNEAIQKVQGDLNPFVVMPGLIDKVQDF